jgi:hypothetical protein
MVDNIRFQKILPSLSSTGKVNKADRQKKKHEQPRFGKFLRPKQDKENDTARENNEEDSQAEDKIGKNKTAVASDCESLQPIEPNDQGKIIDVRV